MCFCICCNQSETAASTTNTESVVHKAHGSAAESPDAHLVHDASIHALKDARHSAEDGGLQDGTVVKQLLRVTWQEKAAPNTQYICITWAHCDANGCNIMCVVCTKVYEAA